jgi:hypothetical protein
MCGERLGHRRKNVKKFGLHRFSFARARMFLAAERLSKQEFVRGTQEILAALFL